jgi:aspartyl-tRNA(Asn)/glutamyl-tRNA(Gln) amidotransferase subunit B
MEDYIPTIGLEIHAELRTETKMFCNSKNDPDEDNPNANICPVCMGYPGSLPTLNKGAIRHVLSLGVAVGGELADYTEFDRKNYFYPDIPKGYQISQYAHPLVRGGKLAGVDLTRVHLEEDTARSAHLSGKGEDTDASFLDFNRAGVPLMELVTEPVIHDAESASRFARELQLLLIYLGASHANMEKGEMRVEANISVSKDRTLGTKVEVKNLNSFKAVEKAIRFEVGRHIEILKSGEAVVQETRGWDENKEITFSQRVKEDSHDYRYFPDPDLPKLFVSEIPDFDRQKLQSELPELPEEKRARLREEYGLKEGDIEILVRDRELGEYFERAAKNLSKDEAVLLANYLISDLSKILKESSKEISETSILPEAFAELIRMAERGEVSSRGAKDILKILSSEGGEPRAVAEFNNLFQKSDEEELKKIVDRVILENDKAVEEYKKGNTASIQFLIGQSMKLSKGSGNPKILKEIFEKIL